MSNPRRPSTENPPRSIILLTALLALSGYGCAHYSVASFDATHSAAAAVQQREIEGLYVAVESLTASVDSNKFFARNLTRYGYVPVLVMLEMDQASSATFDVSRHDLRLVLDDGTRLEATEPTEIAELVAYSHWRTALGFVFLIVPGFFVASSVGDANEALLHDYKNKALESARLNPNSRSYRGVVFFRLPRDHAGDLNVEDSFLEVKIYRRGRSGELDRVFDLPVHFDA